MQIAPSATVLEHHIQLTWGATRSGWARWLVAFAPLLGAVLWDALLPEAMLFVALALIAGSTLVQVVHDELPTPRASNVRAFLLGTALYAALSVLRWR
jgi:hypothetical protein